MRQLKITKSITNRDSQSLEKYLQEIGKVELISAEDAPAQSQQQPQLTPEQMQQLQQQMQAQGQ